MFFSIGTTADLRFPNNHRVGNLWINCDNDWQRTNDTFSKGYSDNYCIIVANEAGVNIDHSVPRSFPLWDQSACVSNLPAPGNWQQLWVDDTVTVDLAGKICVTKNNLDLSMPVANLGFDAAFQQMVEKLNNSVDLLKKCNKQNLKLFCTGGVDTFLLYAMLIKNNIEFELIINEHFAVDDFVKDNHTALNSLWAYKQIHHWSEPTWLATGSHGDEYLLRGPAVIAMLTAWHDIDFAKLLTKNSTQYHYYYFLKYKELWKKSWDTRQQLREQFPTKELLNQHILDHLSNDHQHWHLGKTITWTPFKNIDLVKILLQCDVDQLLPQFLNAQWSKKLVEFYCPDVCKYISTYKNHNTKQYLNSFIDWHHNISHHVQS